MIEADDQSSWKQHFPTYQFKERDVALEEYRFATKTLEAEERVFLNAANLSVVVGAALGSLALGTLERLAATFAPVVPHAFTLILILSIVIGFAVLSLRYFADRQKAVCFAARKVIVLRRMLGMTYGSLQLVLPNWRIEGADEPFAIRLFPGWNTYAAYPCYAIAGIAAVVAFFVLAALIKHLEFSGLTLPIHPMLVVIGCAALAFAALAWTYRKALLDTHERVGLLAVCRIAKAMNLTLVTNFEYVIYRGILAKHELHRLGIDLGPAKRLLVHIEDKEFFVHRGVSLRGLVRLAASTLGLRRRSGGSTITQQLVRTLFIHDQRKLFRRKVVEILLARWFDRVVTKNDQLEMYLASVRFEVGVLGIAQALRWFFGAISKDISLQMAFFLIERVSNVRSRLLVEKIDQTLRNAVTAGVLDDAQVAEVISLYVKAIREGKIQDSEGHGIIRLKRTWFQA